MPLAPTSLARYRALQPRSQAYMQMWLIGPTGIRSSVIVALLDTGAEYSGVDQAVATQVGYPLHSLPRMSITLASGAVTTVRIVRNAQLDVEGHLIKVSRLMVLGANAVPLLAPKDLLMASEFGFDSSDVFFE